MNKSTEEIRQRVIKKINENQNIDDSNISVEVKEGAVKLIGTVSTFFEYRIAEQNALLVVGVYSVNNQLEVSFPPDLTFPGDMNENK